MRDKVTSPNTTEHINKNNIHNKNKTQEQERHSHTWLSIKVLATGSVINMSLC